MGKLVIRLIWASIIFSGLSFMSMSAHADTPTFVVAANDAAQHIKAAAIYVCDGTNDNVDINDAINALPSGGGRIMLSEGTFNIADSILIQDKQVILQGQGSGGRASVSTGTIISAASTYNKDFISIKSTAGYSEKVKGTTIRDLQVRQEGPSTSTPYAHGIHGYGGTNAAVEIFLQNVRTCQVGGIGIWLEGGGNFMENIYVADSYFEGIHLSGGDHVGNNLVAASNGRCKDSGTGNNGRDGIVMGSGNMLSNVYSFGNSRYGIHFEGSGGHRTILNGFAVESNSRAGIRVDTGFANLVITSGQAVHNGDPQGGDNQPAAIDGPGLSIDGVDIIVSDILAGDTARAGNQRIGIVCFESARRVRFSNCRITDHDQVGALLAGAQRIEFLGCTFKDNGQGTVNTYDDIRLESRSNSYSVRNKVTDCLFISDVYKVRYAISEQDSNQNFNLYYDNMFDGNQVTGAVQIQGPNSNAWQNIGYNTEWAGATTITSGNTYVDVTHYLASTPTTVLVTPQADTRFWVSNIGGTTFRINVPTAAPAGGWNFSWRAEF